MSLAFELDRYKNVEAVTGRKVLSARSIRDMNIARNVHNFYQARNGAENLAEWVQANPDGQSILEWARKEAQECGYL